MERTHRQPVFLEGTMDSIIVTSHVYFTIWLKSGIRGLQTMQLSILLFRGNRLFAGRLFLAGFNVITMTSVPKNCRTSEGKERLGKCVYNASLSTQFAVLLQIRTNVFTVKYGLRLKKELSIAHVVQDEQ